MILFSRKKNQEKQNILRAPKKPNYEFKTYQLPSGYCGPTKRLGKDVLIPLSSEQNTNVLVLGSAGSGKKYSYIEPNIMTADHHSNCIVYMGKSEAEDIIDRMTERKTFKIDLSKRPIDYFSLITDRVDAERFVNKMFDAHKFLFDDEKTDEFFLKAEKRILLDIILVLLDSPEKCNHKNIVEKLSGDTNGDAAYWSESIRFLSSAVRKSVIMSLMVRLNELLPGDTIDLSSFVHDFMHKTNTVLFVETDWFEKSVYESIFLDELVYRYTMMYDEKAPMTRVIMDEASLCFYDTRLFCVEARLFKLSVDFIYQSITNLETQHPDDYYTVVCNSIAIVCLGTNDKSTIEFLAEAAGITTEDAITSLNHMIDLRVNRMIDLRVMPLEDELILCPTLDKDPIVARKIRF